MYTVKFYEDRNGKSEVYNYISSLQRKGDKNSLINLSKILAYLKQLELHGTRIGTPYVKHLRNDIWELRPLKNRLLFAYYKDNQFIVLHYFIKETAKTPPREIEIAEKRLKDYKERFANENLK